jgi:glycosyltransferase involved in cell wall biosynthesis
VRLAWFSPLPPVRSGIADYTAELLPALIARRGGSRAAPADAGATDGPLPDATDQLIAGASAAATAKPVARAADPAIVDAVDVFVGSEAELAWNAPPGVSIRPAHEFVWRHHVAPYGLVVYQVGNAWCHDYTWPYLFRWPGLVVLHDGQLHHARAWSLLRRQRGADYRSELANDQPDAPPEFAEIALSGFGGPIYYLWPMLRAVLASARAVAVHGPGLARQIAARYATAEPLAIPMGVADPRAAASPSRAEIRARHGIAPGAFVVAALGGITPEKRIAEGLRAVAAVRRARPDVHVLLVGEQAPHVGAQEIARALDLTDRITLTGYVPDAELPGYLAAADAALCLRWPTTGETSASWLRAIAAGLPTVVTDLAHQADLPVLDPRTWTVQHTGRTPEQPAPVAIAIDVLDEEHSLRLALRRLATDEELCRQLGRAARKHYESQHTVQRMVDGYRGAIARAAAGPGPATASLPSHLRPDPLAHARELLEPFGLDPDALLR